MKQDSALFLFPSSFTLHPSSFTLHPSSFTLHPSSFILHPSPFILHPSSFPMTRIKRINLWQSIVDGIVTDYRRLDKACDAALTAGAMDPSGPLYDAIWRSFSGMLDRLDVNDWITWHIYENECGAKSLEAKGCGKRAMTPIKTSRDLARLIVESEPSSFRCP
jgi:hypothetical protein